jgi:hypothetical protein
MRYLVDGACVEGLKPLSQHPKCGRAELSEYEKDTTQNACIVRRTANYSCYRTIQFFFVYGGITLFPNSFQNTLTKRIGSKIYNSPHLYNVTITDSGEERIP